MSHLTTEEAAARLGMRPQTLRASLCKTGHYLHIRPIKLSNRMLRWPEAEIDRVLSGMEALPVAAPVKAGEKEDRAPRARMEREEKGLF